MIDPDKIPTIGTHRGVALHDGQSPERLDVVRVAIDAVYEVSDMARLEAIALDISWPPESRTFAAAKLQAIYQIAVDERRQRPEIDLVRVEAATCALNSQNWRDPWFYGSLLDAGPRPGQPGAVKRERPLVD